MTRALLIFAAAAFAILACMGIYIADSHYVTGSVQGAGYLRMAVFEIAVALLFAWLAYRSRP